MTSFDTLLTQAPNAGGVSEQDFRLNILNALLQTPHKNFEPYMPLFAHILQSDPLFFGHLAAWYSKNGTVRDLKQLFVALLSVSKFGPEHREAAYALLNDLPPYQVESVVRLIKGSANKAGQFRKGLGKIVSTSMRTAVKDYLRAREADQDWFDSTVLMARKSLRYLYSTLRIKPSAYADQILFKDKPLEGSRLHSLKRIAASKDPAEQARLIVENKIPYRIAATIVSEMSAPVLAALITVMSPAEVINNMNSLNQRGADSNPDLKKLIEEKLKAAKGDSRVSALKTREAVKNSSADADLAKLAIEAGDARMSAGKKIKKSTALLIDKSGSLEDAIQVGKQLAAAIAPACINGLHVIAFDEMPYAIEPKGNQMSDWEQAFKGIEARGGTSCGAPIKKLLRDRRVVEQIIMVTDEAENQPPFFLQSLKEYSKELGVEPNVIIVHVGKPGDLIIKSLKAAGLQADVFTFKGDYYSLPTIIPMLAGGSRLDLLGEIMDFPLPKRKQAKEAVAV